MALDTPVPTTPTYCTAVNVANLRREPQYSDNEDPKRMSRTFVNTLILEKEDYIDRLTMHAWRERKVTNEYPPFEAYAEFPGFVPFDLRHRAVRTLSSASGDKLEVRAGSTWEDYVVTRTEGLGGDYWVQDDTGVVYLKRRYLPHIRDPVRVTYRYGETAVPAAIQGATMRLVAAELEGGSIRAGNAEIVSPGSRATAWVEEAHRMLAPFMGVR